MLVLIAGHSFTRRLQDYSRNHSWTPGPEFTSTCFCGQGGAYIEGHRSLKAQVESQIRKLAPQMLCLDLGSNDLDVGTDPVQLANSYVHWARELTTRYGITVTILQALPRREAQFPGSREATISFNTRVASLVKGKKAIHYWTHKGFWSPNSPLLDGKGIHPSPKGMRKYAFSIRRAIQDMVNKHK